MSTVKFNAGKFFENNLLFITGISGSGKSTISKIRLYMSSMMMLRNVQRESLIVMI